MKSNPWHKRYHSDALTGYRGLSLELRGAYTTILDLLYDEGGPIDESDRWWAGMLDCSTRKWRSIRDQLLLAGKITVTDDGTISNRRFEKEREKQLKMSRKQSENALKRTRKKPERAEKANEINETGQPPHTPTSSQLEARNQKLEDSSPDARAREVWDFSERCLDAASIDPMQRMNQHHTARKWMDAADAAKVPRDEVIETVKARTASKRDGPASSLAYFNQPVADMIAAYHQPLPEGNPHHGRSDNRNQQPYKRRDGRGGVGRPPDWQPEDDPVLAGMVRLVSATDGGETGGDQSPVSGTDPAISAEGSGGLLPGPDPAMAQGAGPRD